MNKKITKIDIIKDVADETEIPYYKIKHIIDIFIDKLGDSIIQNDLVNIINLGSFEKTKTKPRKGRLNNETYIIPSKTKIKFKLSNKILKKIN